MQNALCAKVLMHGKELRMIKANTELLTMLATCTPEVVVKKTNKKERKTRDPLLYFELLNYENIMKYVG